MSNHSFEEQLLRLISEAKSELVTRALRLEALEKEVVTLETEIRGYEITLQGFQKRTGRQKQSEINWGELMAGAKTHKDQIVIVMKQLGGIASPPQITDILYTKGFIKSKKRANAYQIVQSNLAQLIDKTIVEKMETGEYRLIGSQSI